MAWLWSPQAITMYSYLALGFFVTLRLWLDPASRRQVGDPQDVNQATWFVRYAANAVEHFRLPALSAVTMNAPHGVNLMWNTAFLLPGIVVSPVTALFGPQVALTTLLVIGFAGSAAAMFYVLRFWGASVLAAALGGGLYGFSPALVNSGIGHYSIVIAVLPPLMLDRLLRLVTGKGRPVRNGIWLGLFAAGQLFVSEEGLVDAIIAAAIMLLVLAACRPREVRSRIRPLLAGLGTAAGLAAVLCARAFWVQFHGVRTKGAAATVIINYGGQHTNLGTLPYAFINPSGTVLLHTAGTAQIASNYPQPSPEYLAYLGIPLILLLLVAVVYFWQNLGIRVAGVTCILLEWLAMGATPIIHPRPVSLPGFLLPWGLAQHLPVIGGMVPDRLCILADAMAAFVLAFALDKARSGAVAPVAKWRHGAKIAAGIAVVALLPVIPSPYGVAKTNPLPAGWQATFAALHLSKDTRVLLAPFPYSATSEVMRWQAGTNEPYTMIGGDFIAPDEPGNIGRAGRSGLTDTTKYIDALWFQSPTAALPSTAQISADMASMKPQAVVAVAAPGTPLGKFLVRLFGPPTVSNGQVLGWRLSPSQISALANG